MKKKKLDTVETIESPSFSYNVNTQQKKTIVNVFYNESDLADFIRNHPDYVIISVFANEGHITGIFMFYE